jgi:hypothetical protein
MGTSNSTPTFGTVAMKVHQPATNLMCSATIRSSDGETIHSTHACGLHPRAKLESISRFNYAQYLTPKETTFQDPVMVSSICTYAYTRRYALPIEAHPAMVAFLEKNAAHHPIEAVERRDMLEICRHMRRVLDLTAADEEAVFTIYWMSRGFMFDSDNVTCEYRNAAYG